MAKMQNGGTGTPEAPISTRFLEPAPKRVQPKSADIAPGPGFMIRRTFRRPDPEIVAGFEPFESTDISDSLNRLYTMGEAIHNVVNDAPLLGPACTVKVYPGDNLMVHKILDIAQPGDVVVVDGSGSMNAALIGDLVANKARHRGIAGFIIDGLVRDLPGLRECGLPIYARGVTPFGPLHRGPGEVNYPVSCGGIVVKPGDVIRADLSGVTVVPRDWSGEILKRLEAGREALAKYTDDVKRGVFSNAWVDDQLEASGCLFDD
ncbi:RraA family protein [Maritimibacter sp. DP07]|jgi:RraA family protein|uniref:Putative 4-hydroxy-4-methyl-2-oxoglutarate aldolase n=1 Tax=Maritimibacter harenae TaxID=2606218 RepID=A0A845LX23_9RHOB|nr:RraA family protein [Maritimibacter harenae]MZR12500.1 RraA family protein [Maritimibacter harenae]